MALNVTLYGPVCFCIFGSATSVDVEESLYKKAQALGISVVTISQVCCRGFVSILPVFVPSPKSWMYWGLGQLRCATCFANFYKVSTKKIRLCIMKRSFLYGQIWKNI